MIVKTLISVLLMSVGFLIVGFILVGCSTVSFECVPIEAYEPRKLGNYAPSTHANMLGKVQPEYNVTGEWIRAEVCDGTRSFRLPNDESVAGLIRLRIGNDTSVVFSDLVLKYATTRRLQVRMHIESDSTRLAMSSSNNVDTCYTLFVDNVYVVNGCR